MVKELEKRLPFREMYSKADFISRVSPDATLEDLITYWRKRVDVYYDSTKATITVQVQAFDPDDADRIAKATVEIVRGLVNDLSAQSRRDAVQFAAAEVARSELRVRGARTDVLKFRLAHNDLDPIQSATATLGVANQLEAERSKLLSDLASVQGYLADDAPSVQMLKSRIAAVSGEIARIQGQVSGGTNNISDAEKQAPAAATPAPADAGAATAAAAEGAPSGGNATVALTEDIVNAGGKLSDDDIETLLKGQSKSTEAAAKPNAIASIVGEFQELQLNQEFAEKAYTAAMASLDHARAEASRTQAYLAIYGEPSIADEATYPRRWLNIWMVLVLASVLWGVGMLGTLTVRDHVR
jgi:capsular polysaccharide transport system permease protein